jgi:hypothetical protein
MKKLLEAITGDDNLTIEPAYLWGAIFATAGLGMQIYAVVKGATFDLQGYGIGSAAMLAGLGLGKKLGTQ